MTDFFCYLYNKACPHNPNLFLLRIKFYSSLRFFIRLSANIFLPIYFRCTYKNNKFSLPLSKSDSMPKVIVSLTSFPARINRLWLVIETLLRQLKKPDLIILWLSKDQFSSIDSLPKSLLQLQKRGLKIVFKDGDLRSHKKFYYVFQEYSNDFIITVDDDIFYSNRLISDLFLGLEFNPKNIIACYTKIIRHNSDGVLKRYSEWPVTSKKISNSSKLFFGSGGGVLYPPKSLYQDLCRTDLFMRLTPHADDIWLNAMTRLANTKVSSIVDNFILLPVMNRNDLTLSSINNNDNNPQNDIQINKVREYYIMNNKIDPFKIY